MNNNNIMTKIRELAAAGVIQDHLAGDRLDAAMAVERKRRRGAEVVERWRVAARADMEGQELYKFEWRWTCKLCGFSDVGFDHAELKDIADLCPSNPPCYHYCPCGGSPPVDTPLTTLYCPPDLDDCFEILSDSSADIVMVKQEPVEEDECEDSPTERCEACATGNMRRNVVHWCDKDELSMKRDLCGM